MKSSIITLMLGSTLFLSSVILAEYKEDIITTTQIWPQWRGPNRDGHITGPQWPDRLNKGGLKELWRIPLNPSYSGPIVTAELVFTTATKNKTSEVVLAIDRQTGQERWRTEWDGSMKVPFFARSNGSWIRATPAYDGTSIYVAGMRDVLVCLNAKTGHEQWRVNFVEQINTPMPAFGFVSSPLVDGDAVFVQAGAGVIKLNKNTGALIWRTLHDDGGMNGSAFSSPIIADIAGQRQLLVQTRNVLAGIDIDTGNMLWNHTIPAFRGMNILTPVVVGDAIFTSSYRNNSWLFQLSKNKDQFQVMEAWKNTAQGYMSTPVVIGGHA